MHFPRTRPHPTGFTWIELIVVLFIILVLFALLMPAMRVTQEPARRTQCQNNLKQLGLALHNYHDSYGCFPPAMGGTGVGPTDLEGNANRLSGVVALLPFLEQQKLWDQIAGPSEIDGKHYPAMGPAPWVSTFPPWREQLTVLSCPATPIPNLPFGTTNYAFSIGDVAREIHTIPTVHRGAFVPGVTIRIEDIADGTSNMVGMAEIGGDEPRRLGTAFAINQPKQILDNPSLCRTTIQPDGWFTDPDAYEQSVALGREPRGARWADGAAGFSLINTILPPNSPSCSIGPDGVHDGLYSAGSTHEGGAFALVMDGSVRFIPNIIDAGQATQPTLHPDDYADSENPVASPYGVWGALGTIAGNDRSEE